MRAGSRVHSALWTVRAILWIFRLIIWVGNIQVHHRKWSIHQICSVCARRRDVCVFGKGILWREICRTLFTIVLSGSATFTEYVLLICTRRPLPRAIDGSATQHPCDVRPRLRHPPRPLPPGVLDGSDTQHTCEVHRSFSNVEMNYLPLHTDRHAERTALYIRITAIYISAELNKIYQETFKSTKYKFWYTGKFETILYLNMHI